MLLVQAWVITDEAAAIFGFLVVFPSSTEKGRILLVLILIVVSIELK